MDAEARRWLDENDHLALAYSPNFSPQKERIFVDALVPYVWSGTKFSDDLGAPGYSGGWFNSDIDLQEERFALHSSASPSSVGESSEKAAPVTSRPGPAAHSDGSPRTPRMVLLPYPNRVEVRFDGLIDPEWIQIATTGRRKRRGIHMFIFAAVCALLLSGLLGLNFVQAIAFIGLCELATMAWVKR